MNTKFNVLLLGMMVTLSCFPLFAEDEIDETILFEPTQMFDHAISEKQVNVISPKSDKVQFSGALYAKGSYSVDRSNKWTANAFQSYLLGDLLLDIRLQKGYKAFADFAFADSNLAETPFLFKELFVDMNYDYRIFHRFGKQVLQWGRTYLWNPTDLVNVERRSFFDLDALRQGSFGSKWHVPIGLEQNVYVFVDMNQAQNLDQFAMASKYEFLIGNTEVGLSMWNKYKQQSVYGVDFSSSLWGNRVLGEIALRPERESQASFSVQKDFDWELNDRIYLIYELFYNGLEHTNRYYQAVFLSIQKFPLMNVNTQLNTIMNLIDYSGVFSSVFSISPVYDFTVDLKFNFYFGKAQSEFMTSGKALDVELATSISF